ncbi:CoA pyrophosphatase [Eubacterium ramulus]|uniref:NUDIX hydrolase n=1 Tax=Eubacterium ramulus TaxID=39490 RepID=UPI003520D8E3
MAHQPGDVCLPGGMVEDGEEPREAVLRELQEELLLSEEQIHYLGDMDKLYTGSSLIMYSFAAEVTEYQNTFSPAEVGEVFRVPLEFFLHTEPKCYVTRARVEPGEDFPYELICGGRDYNWRSRKEKVCFYQYEGHVIWGLTAKMMRAFTEVIR